MDKSKNIESNFLPYGENLRVMLSHTELSESNLKNVLNSKGVFLSKYEKNDTIPSLMRIILDPSEFQYLVDLQSSREENTKYRTSWLPLNKDVDLIQVLPDLNLNKLIADSKVYSPTYKVIGSPKFKRVDKNKNKLELEYTIERDNNTKGWDERKTLHTGSITIEKIRDERIQIVTRKIHTSKESNELGELILKNIKTHLKENKHIEEKADFERILFSHFINESRINFLLGFTSSFDPSLEFEKLTDLEVNPDKLIDPPEDLKTILKGIRKLKVQGKELQNHEIISRKEFHNKIIFSSITLKYKFTTAEGTGFCTVEFVFTDYVDKQKENSEFQFLIHSLALDKVYRQSANRRKIDKILNQILESQKKHLYNLYKN